MVHVLDVAQGALANAQAAEQFVGFQQLGPQHLGQLATGQAPHDFHLEQPVLGMYVAEGTVQVGLVLGADMRHASVVVAHGDRTLQMGQLHRALASRLLAVHVPAGANHKGYEQDGQRGQDAFHGLSLISRSP